MRQAVAWLTALLAAPAVGAAAEPTPGERVLAEVEALCVATGADPARVYAAASAAGYGRSPDPEMADDGISDPAQELRKPFPTIWLIKPIGSERLALQTSVLRGDDETLRARYCSVGLLHAGSPEMAAVLKSRFGADANRARGTRRQWVFAETPQGRQLLSDVTPDALTAALARGPLYMLGAREPSDNTIEFLAVSRIAPPPAGRRPAVITPPQWLRKPSGEDMRRYYPAAAFEGKVEGRAVIECVVTADGTMTDCKVVEETPAGQGFGAASLRVASRFRMRTTTLDGIPVMGAHVRIPLNWRVEE